MLDLERSVNSEVFYLGKFGRRGKQKPGIQSGAQKVE